MYRPIATLRDCVGLGRCQRRKARSSGCNSTPCALKYVMVTGRGSASLPSASAGVFCDVPHVPGVQLSAGAVFSGTAGGTTAVPHVPDSACNRASKSSSAMAHPKFARVDAVQPHSASVYSVGFGALGGPAVDQGASLL